MCSCIINWKNHASAHGASFDLFAKMLDNIILSLVICLTQCVQVDIVTLVFWFVKKPRYICRVPDL